jgi:hypothetical protein
MISILTKTTGIRAQLPVGTIFVGTTSFESLRDKIIIFPPP